MNLKFWQKKKPGDEADPKDAEETESLQAGWLDRVKNALAMIRLPWRKQHSPDNGEMPEASAAPDEKEPRAETAEPRLAANSRKKLLLLGGAAGLLVLLIAGGIAVWLLQAPEPQQETPPAQATPRQGVKSSPAQPPEQQKEPVAAANEMEAQIEALRKQNQEMQKQIETLKARQEKPAAPGADARTAAQAGDEVLVINGKDPRKSAELLKKAIEEMNAASASKNSSRNK